VASQNGSGEAQKRIPSRLRIAVWAAFCAFPLVLGLSFSFQVSTGSTYQITLNTPYIGYGGRTDQQAGHPEPASHRQFASREGMLEAAHGGFDRGP
jgi:hypothetical protein